MAFCSKVGNELGYWDTQGVRDAEQSVETNPFFAALDFAEIYRMEAGFLRQFLLTHSCLLAVFSDRFSEDFSPFCNARHSGLEKQERREENTPHRDLFFACKLGNI